MLREEQLFFRKKFIFLEAKFTFDDLKLILTITLLLDSTLVKVSVKILKL